MAGNPLVAAPSTGVSPYAGAFVLQDGQALAEAIQSGNWVEGGIAALSAGLDAAAAISDPLGTLIANGLGWLIDHLDPLKSWMDDLTGNGAEVAAFAQTWQNIAGRLNESAQLYNSRLADLDGMSGAAVDAYRQFAGDTVDHLNGAATWASAVGTGLKVASELVQAVHDLVVQVLSQLVGSIISMAIEAACTLGLAAPLIIEQVSTRVADLAGEIGSRLTKLLSSFKSLEELLGRLRGVFDDAGSLFKDLLHGEGGEIGRPSTNVGDTPAVGGADDFERLDGLSPEQRQAIIDTPKADRPDPSTYLSSDYIDSHLAQFQNGATKFMNKDSLDLHGIGQRDGTSFVMPSSEIDQMMKETGGDPRAMEQALGLPDGFFDSNIVRVDVQDPGDFGLRMPSGREAGANEFWIPGGHLPSGSSEAVIDGGRVPADRFTVSEDLTK